MTMKKEAFPPSKKNLSVSLLHLENDMVNKV